MATNRILEFTPSQEEAIVARILVLLHQAVDEHFPSAEKATRQFTKTVFSDDSERTALGNPEREAAVAHGFGNEEKTGPGEKPPEAPLPPTPPQAQPVSAGAGNRAPPSKPPTPQVSVPPPPTPVPPPAVTQPLSRPAATAPMPSAAAATAGGMSAASALSGMPTGMSGIGKRGKGEGRDWVTMATLALLVAGLILLAYSFLV